MNDLRVLRGRQESGREALDAVLAGADPGCSAAMLAQTTTAQSYPTAAGVFYAVVPVDVDGDETEGAAATYVPRASSLAYALNLGTVSPPAGTTIVCHAVGGRWCFRYDG